MPISTLFITLGDSTYQAGHAWYVMILWYDMCLLATEFCQLLWHPLHTLRVSSDLCHRCYTSSMCMVDWSHLSGWTTTWNTAWIQLKAGKDYTIKMSVSCFRVWSTGQHYVNNPVRLPLGGFWTWCGFTFSVNTIKGVITQRQQVLTGFLESLNLACIVKRTMLSSVSAAFSSVFLSVMEKSGQESQRGAMHLW